MGDKTKVCSKCKKEMLLVDFHKDATKTDGLYPSCKDCRTNRLATTAIAEMRMISGKVCTNCGEMRGPDHYYKDSRRRDGMQSHCVYCFLKNTKAYRKTDKGKASRRREYKNGRNNPEFLQARNAHKIVKRAVDSGRITKATNCSMCGEGGKIYGHHYAGYDKDSTLKVIWLCAQCHSDVHNCFVPSLP